MSKAEKFIEDSTRTCSNKIDYAQINREGWTPLDPVIDFRPWLTPDEARKAVEIAREEELECVKYQLELRLPETLDYNGIKVNRKDFIKYFTKAMKDE